MDEKFLQLFKLGDSQIIPEFANEIRRRGTFQELIQSIEFTHSSLQDLDQQIDIIKHQKKKRFFDLLALITTTLPYVEIYFDFSPPIYIDTLPYIKRYPSQGTYIPLHECRIVEPDKTLAITYTVKEISLDHSPFSLQTSSFYSSFFIKLEKAFSNPIYLINLGKRFAPNMQTFVPNIQSNTNLGFSLLLSLNLLQYLKLVNSTYNLNIDWTDPHA